MFTSIVTEINLLINMKNEELKLNLNNKVNISRANYNFKIGNYSFIKKGFGSETKVKDHRKDFLLTKNIFDEII